MKDEKSTSPQASNGEPTVKKLPPLPSEPGSYVFDGKAWVHDMNDKAMKQRLNTRGK